MAHRRRDMKPYVTRNGQRLNALARPGFVNESARASADASCNASSGAAKALSSEAVPAAAPQRGNDGLLIIQIGFDYGTAYSKCIFRDLVADIAHLHLPRRVQAGRLPFLVPSCLIVNNGRFERHLDPDVYYPKHGVFHLKIALEKVARGQFEDGVLDQFRGLYPGVERDDLVRIVEAANVYFLASALAEVRASIRMTLAGMASPQPAEIFVNMAIPVAGASDQAVIDAFRGVLSRAWQISESDAAVDGASRIPLPGDLASGDHAQGSVRHEYCQIYPEVSASVQGFVRSPAAKEGSYLCTDVGAGTVDQSFFIFRRREDGGWLTYLDAQVLELGSSQIERMAARYQGASTSVAIEELRRLKEVGRTTAALNAARDEIERRLRSETQKQLCRINKKVYVSSDVERADLLLTGGGASGHPYEYAVVDSFERPCLARKIDPRVVGMMPVPPDLDLGPEKAAWMERLHVAYGLSFHVSNLTAHTYPHELPNVSAEEKRIETGYIRPAPTKDEC